MNSALGSVVGNRFDDARKTALKPHLMERLVALTVRAVPLDTLISEGGLMAFVPNYADPRAAATVAPKAQPAEGDDEPVCVVGFDPKYSPLQVGDRVRKVKGGTNLNCTGVVDQGPGCDPTRPGCFHVAWCENPAGDDGWWNSRDNWEIVSRGEPKPPAPAFDPMTEPLQLGDVVEIVHPNNPNRGQQVSVVRIGSGGEIFTSEDCGRRSWEGRSALKLIRKATPA